VTARTSSPRAIREVAGLRWTSLPLAGGILRGGRARALLGGRMPVIPEAQSRWLHRGRGGSLADGRHGPSTFDPGNPTGARCQRAARRLRRSAGEGPPEPRGTLLESAAGEGLFGRVTTFLRNSLGRPTTDGTPYPVLGDGTFACCFGGSFPPAASRRKMQGHPLRHLRLFSLEGRPAFRVGRRARSSPISVVRSPADRVACWCSRFFRPSKIPKRAPGPRQPQGASAIAFPGPSKPRRAPVP